MESCYNFTMRRLLTLTTVIFLAVLLSGCNDPMVADMEAKRREVTFMAEREMQRCRSLAASQTRALPPAQVADMEAERRDLDSMVEQGRWSTLSGPRADAFHPAP